MWVGRSLPKQRATIGERAQGARSADLPAKPACGDAEATATLTPGRRELGAAKTQRSSLHAYKGHLKCQRVAG